MTSSLHGNIDDSYVFHGLVCFSVCFHHRYIMYYLHSLTYPTKYCVLIVQPRLKKNKKTAYKYVSSYPALVFFGAENVSAFCMCWIYHHLSAHAYTVKPVLSGYSKEDQKFVFKTDNREKWCKICLLLSCLALYKIINAKISPTLSSQVTTSVVSSLIFFMFLGSQYCKQYDPNQVY